MANSNRSKIKSRFHLPKPKAGSYTGHLEKLKDKLIRKAKLKKNYSKILKAENAMQTDPPLAAPEASTAQTSSNKKGKQRANMDEDAHEGQKRKAAQAFEHPSDEDVTFDAEELEVEEGTSSSNNVHMHPARRAALSGKKPDRKTSAKKPRPAMPPPSKKRKTQDEIEALRIKRQLERDAWNRKTKKGQPNLNSRMGVLLSKIERTVGYKA